MAFRKKYINEIFGTVLVLSALLSTASAVNCFGKSFHCVNSTHFVICVDLGGGVSQSIDDFLIPCPPPTVCQGTNHFECEYPAVTTPSTTLSNVISETTEPWEEIVVTTNSPPKNTSTTKEYSEKYMNTVSITSVAEDILTTDTTTDGSTEASSLRDVNNNSNVTETVTIYPIIEVTTGFDGITQTSSDNTVTGAAEITTVMSQMIPLHQIQNVTNETIIDNVTLTFSKMEPTVALDNSYTLAQNDSAGEVGNITATSQSDNATSENIIDDIVTPGTSLIDSSTSTERLLTSTTDESIVTGVNLVVTRAQTLVSTDELQNSPNINIHTSEPALIQNTLGIEQFQKPYFEENFTTESVQISEKEQSTFLTRDIVQNVPAQLPTTTFQSTVTNVTSVIVKDEVTDETTIASEKSTTSTYEVNFSTADHNTYTTEATLAVAAYSKQDTQKTSESDQVPTKWTDEKIVYSGNEQPTTAVNSLPININVTSEQPTTFTTETQKVLVDEQPKINNDDSAIGRVQKVVDTGIELPKPSQKNLTTDSDIITEIPSGLAAETQQQQRTGHIIVNKNITTTGNDAAAGASVLHTDIQKPIDKGVEQSKDSTQSLATDNDSLTENPSEFTTETQKILVTEQPKINKDNSVTEPVQKVIDMGIEPPTSGQKRLTTDPDVKTENPSDLAAETQQQQGTEQIIINKNIATGNDVVAGASVLPTDALKPIDKGVEQSKDSTQSLATDNDLITENPSEFTTETQKIIVTEQPKINKANSVTEPVQKLIDMGIEPPTSGQKRLTTDPDAKTKNPSDLAAETQQQQGTEQIIINKNIATGNDVVAGASVLPTDAQKPIDKGVEQSKYSTQSLATDNDSLTENPSEFTTETQKILVTEQPKINKDNTATESEQKVIDMGIEPPKSGQKRLTTDPDAKTENTSDLAAETQQQQRTEPIIINKNMATGNDVETGASVLPTKAQKPIDKGVEQSKYSTHSLATENDSLTENPSEFTTETQKLLVTEQPKINKDNTATEPIQKLIDTGIEPPTSGQKRITTDHDAITENTSDLAAKTQQQQGTEQIRLSKNFTTGNDAEAGASVLHTEAQKPIDKGVEQPKDSTHSLATENDAITENTSEFTTETQKLVVTEQQKINQDYSATEPIQKLIDTGIEPPKLSQKIFTTGPGAITESPSDLAAETQQQQGTKHIIINKNITTTGNDAAAGASFLPTDVQKPIDKGVEQSKDSTQRLATDDDALTKNPSEFTTETQMILITEQPKINKENSVKESEQKVIDMGTEPPKLSQKIFPTDPYAITENPSDLAAETPQQKRIEQIIINKNITTGNDALLGASVLPTAAQEPIDKIIDQSKNSTQNLAADNDALTENPSEFTTETTNKNSSETDNDVITEASILPTETQTPIHKGVVQQKNILATENVDYFTTVTQNSIYMSTDRLTTIRNDLVTSDITIEKADYATDTHEPTKPIIKEKKPIFMGTEKPATNKNYSAIDNFATTQKPSDFTTEAQTPIYTGTEQTRTNSTATDPIPENSVLSIETQKSTFMSTPQPITKATDIDVNVEKANVSTIATSKPISMSTEHPTTFKNDLTMDIKVTTDSAIGSATETSKPRKQTIQIEEKVALGLSDHNIVTAQQKQESLTTDTIPFAAITTDAVTMESVGVTEQPITTALGDGIVTDTNISNITKLQNYISSNIEASGKILVELVNTSTATTIEPTTKKIAKDKIKEETTAFTSSDSDVVNELPVDNVQTIHYIINEQPNLSTSEVTAGTVDSSVPTSVKSVNIKKDDGTSTAESTQNLIYGHQLSTNIDRSDITNPITRDKSFNIISEITTPINDDASSVNTNTKFDTTSTSGINEDNYLSPNTVKTTQDTQNIVDTVDKTQHTPESNLNVSGTAFITKETKTPNNVDGSDVGISNNAAINGYMNKTDKVKSELHTTERVNLMSAENIANQLSATETTATNDLGSTSTFNLNRAVDSLESNLQEDINNKLKNSNSAYSGQLSGAEATSETTATENFTPSLNPNNESSQKDKHLTSNNPVTTGNTNTVIDNLADGTSSFTISNKILKVKDDDSNIMLTENGNIYKSLTSLNTQDKSYVKTTDKPATSHDNVADNQIPKLSTISENETHETLQLSTPTNELTSITRDIENTGTAFTHKSTTVGGKNLESHLLNKNEINQDVQITTQTFGTEQPMQTISPNKNENTNNLLSNPLSNILLDKINQAYKPATESSTPFPIKNDGIINIMAIVSSGTYSIVDDSSTQLHQMQNTNEVTTQASIPLGQTNDNSLKTLNSDLHETKYSASKTNTEGPSVIQPETSLKETSILKEDLFLNRGNVVTPSVIPMTDSTTDFSIKESVKNVYKAIGSYFNTPSETSIPGSFNKKGNGDINPILSPYGFQDSAKTSPSMYKTESSLYGIKDNYDSLNVKIRPVPVVSNLQPLVTYSGYYTKTTKIEITTEASKNHDEGNIILEKPVISAALPVPDYKIEMNTPNINKPIPVASEVTKTSETKKTLKEPVNYATYNPSKYITNTTNNHQYVTEKSNTSSSSKSSGGTVNISSEVSLSSQQTVNAFKTDAKSLSWQSNEQNVVPNKSQYNSSFYADTANSRSNFTDFKTSNNLTNTASKQSHSKPQSNSAINTSQVTEKVGLETNTTKDVNSEANENKLPNNSSSGPSTITGTPSKNVPQDINKNGSSLSRNSTNTTKSNAQGDLKPTTTNLSEHNSGQVKPTTIRPKKIHSAITTLKASITKTTPRPLVTTSENPSKQIPKIAPVNFSCISGTRGRYSDIDDCRKFYICFGNIQPIVGNCPANTVFSDISKLCTKNLSHCIRENEFKCPSAGRFSDMIKDNIYYICVSHKNHLYRFKFQCQKGFTLNKTKIRCEENREIESNQSFSISLSGNSNDRSISSKTSSSSSSTSSSDSSSMSTSTDSSSSSSKDSSSGDSKNNSSSSSDSSSSISKEKKENKEKPEGKEEDEEDEVFECEKEGKFPVRNDCTRYYLCKKNGKSEYRRKIKKCESGDVFHKDKKNRKNSSESSDSESDDDRRPSKRRQRKEKKEEPEGKEGEGDDQEVFECEREGKFPVPGDCRRYYLCKRKRKSEYRRKIKKCDSDEVFHKSKKKCVDADSYEC